MGEIVPRDELEATIAARKELGAEMEAALIDSFVERIEGQLAQRAGERDKALKQRREHQKELILGAMGSRSLSLRSPQSSPESRAYLPSAPCSQ